MAEERDISAIIALPLKIVGVGGGYCVEDADKRVLAYHYGCDDLHINSTALDWRDAKVIAQTVARALTDKATR